MDPDDTLEEIRTAIKMLDEDENGVEALSILTQSVEALDEWLKQGGFLPFDWRNALRQYRGVAL